MRCGELFALRKEDIDFTRNKISITRAIKQHDGKASKPKTTSGIREIDLLPPVREALLEQIESQGGKTYLFPIQEAIPLEVARTLEIFGLVC